jgi:hypothetical protein
VFSHQILTKRSKVLPATLLVGLSVKAVALALATAAEAVDVYCVGVASARLKNTGRQIRDNIFQIFYLLRLRKKL